MGGQEDTSQQQKETKVKNKFKVVFANFPGNGGTRWETSAWCTKTYVEMLKDDRISDIIPIYAGPDVPIPMLRNRVIKEAMKRDCDYVLMIDSDMAPDTPLEGAKPFWSTAWEFMMRRREREKGERLLPAMIAAPYCGPPPHESCFIFRWKNWESDCPDVGYKLEMIEREDSAFRTGIERVAALPTGLILFDLRIFPHLPLPWFDYEYTDEFETDKASTEDVYGSRNAGLLGFPIFVAWDCWANHVKTKHVSKPRPLTIDNISDCMREALKKGKSWSEKMAFVGDPIEEPKPDHPFFAGAATMGATTGDSNGWHSSDAKKYDAQAKQIDMERGCLR